MPDITSDLELLLEFDEVTGTTAADASGNGNHGTLTSLTFDSDGVTGQLNGGLSKNGGGKYVDCGSLGLTDADQTIAGWVTTTASAGFIYMLASLDGVDGGLTLGFYPGLNALVTWINNTQQTYTVQPTLTNGSWHHVAVVYDQSAGELEYYFNGSLVFTDTTVTGTWSEGGVATTLFGSSGQACSLDDVRVYSRALAADDVAALYNLSPTTETRIEELDRNLILDTTTPTYSDDFSSGWTEGISNLTVSRDTVHTCDGSDACTKVTKTAESWSDFAKSWSMDLSDGVTGTTPGYNGVLKFRVPPGSLNETGKRITKMWVFFTSGGVTKGVVVYVPNQDMHAPGWHQIPITLTDAQAGLDWSTVTKVAIRPIWATNTGDQIWFGRIYFVPRPAKARLFFRIDDGIDAAETYCDQLKAQGFRASLGIIPEVLDDLNKLTTATLRRLHSDGHYVLPHCNQIQGVSTGPPGWRKDGSDLTSLADRITHLSSSQADLTALGMGEFNGFPIPPGGWNNPGETYDEHDIQLIRQGYAKALWYAGAGQMQLGEDTDGGDAISFVGSDTYGRHSWAVRANNIDGVSTANVQTMIDDVIRNRGQLTVFGHDNLLDFATTVAYVKTKVDAGELEVGGPRDLVRFSTGEDVGTRGNVRGIIKGDVRELVKG